MKTLSQFLAETHSDMKHRPATDDEVAADVGIAKASLYKHFTSKEELAAAAMIRVLERALAFIAELLDDPHDADPAHAAEQLRRVARWTMEVQLAGEMPSLPAQNSTLRSALITTGTCASPACACFTHAGSCAKVSVALSLPSMRRRSFSSAPSTSSMT